MQNRKVLSLEWNSEGVMDDESGRLTGKDEVTGVGRDGSGYSELGWCEVVGDKPEADSYRDKVKHTERNGQ